MATPRSKPSSGGERPNDIRGNQGPSTDRHNEPVIDPTKNVLDLVYSAISRQDDLRAAENKRIDDLREAESRRVNEMILLRAAFEERLAQAEAKRIDAIRAVDVNAVAVASQRAADQATVLATQVVQSAEALRALVATTATTIATSQQQLVAGLSERLAALERAGYLTQGKSTFTDPAQAELIAEVRALRAARDQTGGRSAGISASWGILLGAVGLIGALLAIFAALRGGT